MDTNLILVHPLVSLGCDLYRKEDPILTVDPFSLPNILEATMTFGPFGRLVC
jgi:hypothetical protein